MEDKKILFITYDLSGYYEGVYQELIRQYRVVDFYNIATLQYKYTNFMQRAYSFFYKIATGEKLKNHYKYQGVIDQIAKKHYDIALIIRPDLFTHPQLQMLRKSCDNLIAYYHDSINHIPRKKKVLHYFDRIYCYEKRDVADYDLTFISNFIYWNEDYPKQPKQFDAYSVMSYDYRFVTLKRVAQFLKNHNITFKFNVVTDKKVTDELIHIDNKRITNAEIMDAISQSNIIVDIHKYGVQDGLTFRVFEAMGFKKKLITTNKDIKTYDFYNSNNIFVIEDVNEINIPDTFFQTPYEELPTAIFEKYTVKAWIDTIFKTTN